MDYEKHDMRIVELDASDVMTDLSNQGTIIGPDSYDDKKDI